MKHTAQCAFRSCVSLLLVLCMVCSLPLTTLAAETSKPLVYVSMGDSMTNGYCLSGYEGESGAANYGTASYANLFAAYLAGYSGTIENDQVIFTGTRGTVDHRPLAISGMRSQDIQWALELDYENDTLINKLYNTDYGSWWHEAGLAGDGRTYNDFVAHDYRYADAAAKILAIYNTDDNGEYFQSSYATADRVNAAVNGLKADTYFPENEAQTQSIGGSAFLQIATEYFQESVKDADVISLGVGNTNFGTFMLNAIMDVAMKADMDFSKDFSIDQARVQAKAVPGAEAKINAMLSSDAYKQMATYLSAMGDTEAKQKEIQYILEYCMVSFISGYIGTLNAIMEANPDAQVIVIALMNAYKSENGKVEDGTLGQLVEAIYGPVNSLLEQLCQEMNAAHEDAEFFFANADYVSCMVDVFGDDFYKSGNSYVKYPGLLKGGEDYTANANSIVRDRFVQEILTGDYLSGAMGVPAGTDLNAFEAGAAAYDLMTGTEKAAYAAQDSEAAKQYAMYLGFENALIRSGTENITIASLRSLSNTDNLLASAQTEILAQTNTNSKNHYEAVAPVVAQIAAGQGASVTAEQVVSMMGAYETMKAKVWAAFADYHEQLKALGHPSIDHVIKCDSCMAGGHGNDGDALLQQVVTAYKTNLADLPYAIVAETVKAEVTDDTIKNLLTADLIKTLCQTADSAAYKAAVYAMVKDVAKNNMGYDLTDEHIDLLLEEDGEFKLASEFVGEDAANIKFLYDSGMLDNFVEGATAKIDLLKNVRAGIIKLLAAETTIKSSAAGIPTIIDGASQLAYLLALPQTMSDVMYNDSNVQGGLTMNARCVLGTGAGGHPSADGHTALFNAVKSVYKFHEHSYTPVVTDPTCTEKGYTTYTCKCGNSYTDDEVDALGHDWNEGTETQDGIVYSCTRCDATQKGLLGDANSDGEINSKDARLILQYDAEMDVSDEINLSVCDVNYDGKVDSKDAREILRYDAGIITEFATEKAA